MGPTLTFSALGSIIPATIGLKNEFSCMCATGILLFAPIIDLSTNSYHLFRAAIAMGKSACRSTGAKRRAGQKVLDEIFLGFPDRFHATLMILIRLRLETPVTLQEQFQNGNLDLYWTLTLAFTAFASRRASTDFICLAVKSKRTTSSFNHYSGSQLSIDNCSVDFDT
jgi:hypothetical protein